MKNTKISNCMYCIVYFANFQNCVIGVRKEGGAQWAKSWGQNALTQPKIELGICSLHENGVEFC